MTGYGTVESAVEAMKLGAFDFITKPFRSEEILLRVHNALDKRQLRQEVHRLRAEGNGAGELFARRAATEAVHELGHSYGLAHCDDRGCVMWFSNSLAETDRKGPRFCPAHAAELRRLMARP